MTARFEVELSDGVREVDVIVRFDDSWLGCDRERLRRLLIDACDRVLDAAVPLPDVERPSPIGTRRN